MLLTEAQILQHVQEFVDAAFNAPDGLALMAEQDAEYGWQGLEYAMRGLPIALCWNEVQRQSYLAWLNDAPWSGDYEDVVMREGWVGT
jgi:hypothetical protein